MTSQHLFMNCFARNESHFGLISLTSVGVVSATDLTKR
jgi:hypothetical protein